MAATQSTVFQYTANDVLDFIDLNISDVHVLVRHPQRHRQQEAATAPVVPGGGANACRGALDVFDAEWVKSAVCKFLVRSVERSDGEEDGDDEHGDA